MRRRQEKDDADTLRLIYVIERAIGKEGLPAHGAVLLAYLGLQTDGSALLSDAREACGFGRTQASRVAESLEGAGLITRSAGEDGRFTMLRLTAKGRSAVERLIQAAHSEE